MIFNYSLINKLVSSIDMYVTVNQLFKLFTWAVFFSGLE